MIGEASQVARPKAKDVGYIPILDGWRAVAILLVLLFHGFNNTDTVGDRYLAPLAQLSGRLGALGVLIFFCISGYLITQKLLSETDTYGSFSVHNFYVKRFFRIIPPLACYLTVIVVLSAFGLIALQKGDWAALFFFTNYVPHSWYTAHFWSLSVEEHFYLFWPFCVLLAGWRRAMWIGVLVIVVVGIWRPYHLSHLATPTAQAFALGHTDMRMDYIMLGCVTALAIYFSPAAARGLKLLGSPLALVALTAVLFLTTRHLPFDVRSIQAILLTLMVCGSSNANSPLLLRVLANPVMLFIGRISYSLYIWQEIFLGPSVNAMLHSPLALPFKFILSFGVATASYYLVEKRFISFGRRFLKKNPVPAPAAGV